MMRTLGAALAAAFAAGCGGEGAAAPQASSHLLLVVVDTLRADHCSAYGYPRPTTPHLGRLAEQGARFEAVYAPSATTGPTHASVFTGLHPRTHGVRRNGVALRPEHETLAEILAAAGWETAAVVGSFVLHRRFGWDQGFGVYQDDFDAKRATVRLEEFEGHRVPAGFDRRAAETTDRAIDWLERTRDPERPFFLFVHYFDPHDPYVPPRAFAERFAAEEEPGSRASAIALYDAEVAYTDAQLGRLLAFLDERGLGEQTLVVATADHGEGLFDHGYLYHDVHLYEEAVRVPLLMRRPGVIPAGRSFAEPVALVDLLPTLLDLLGLGPPPAGLQGLSLAPALLGRGRLDPDRPVFLERRRFQTRRVGGIPVAGEKFALREGSWKYIEAPEEGTRELFHLGRDAGERENLVERESGHAAAIAHQLRAWREATPWAAPAPAPTPEDRRRLDALGYVE